MQQACHHCTCPSASVLPPSPLHVALPQELSWQDALAEVAAESVGGEEALAGTAPADLLPEAVLQQVRGWGRHPLLHCFTARQACTADPCGHAWLRAVRPLWCLIAVPLAPLRLANRNLQVACSPVLLNLATSLAHHKRLLAATAAAQAAAGDGLPVRLREALRARADDLSTTLRTVLCL